MLIELLELVLAVALLERLQVGGGVGEHERRGTARHALNGIEGVAPEQRGVVVLGAAPIDVESQ